MMDESQFTFHPDHSAAPDDRVFVFGSNLAGFHGAGAALAAYQYYGARLGHFEGLCGRSYAIPTKDRQIKTLDMDSIVESIARFSLFTQENPKLKFFVTRVGCGLAGLKDDEIAPLFFEAINCSFPEPWRPFLEKI